jgi:hypothetical protein
LCARGCAAHTRSRDAAGRAKSFAHLERARQRASARLRPRQDRDGRATVGGTPARRDHGTAQDDPWQWSGYPRQDRKNWQGQGTFSSTDSPRRPAGTSRTPATASRQSPISPKRQGSKARASIRRSPTGCRPSVSKPSQNWVKLHHHGFARQDQPRPRSRD